MSLAASRPLRIAVGDTCLHGCEAGSGDPVLLISGWPQSARAWEKIVPLLATDHRVIAVEPPALGHSRPTARYDMASIVDLFRQLADTLALPRFHLVGHDIGCWIGYAFAARFPDLLRTVTLIEAAIPGITPGGAYAFTPEQAKKTWHFAFNFLPDLAEELVPGREHVILDWIFRHRCATPGAISGEARDEYVALYSRPGAFVEALGYYRAIFESGAQNRDLAQTPLSLPVLAVAGELWLGEAMRGAIEPLATDFKMATIPGCAHFPPEEAPGPLADLLRRHFARRR